MNLVSSDFYNKSWFEAVLTCVVDIGKEYFTTQDAYAYVKILSVAYPENNKVESKIRQTLQYLRDAGILKFLDRGNYRLIAPELRRNVFTDFEKFMVEKTAVPNTPLDQIGELAQTFVTRKPNRRSIINRVRDEKLGEAGEKVIIWREKKFLIQSGRKDLADLVEQVSKTKGDHIGYDVLSFDLVGDEKWIEVKTTKGIQTTRFHISENQISTSERNPDNYQLHRLFDFDVTTLKTKLYVLNGNLRTQLSLVPTKYLASPL